MLNQKDISERMSKDINEMEKMLNDYLQFAKTQLQEETTKVNLLLLFRELKEEVNNKNLIIDVENEIKRLNKKIEELGKSLEISNQRLNNDKFVKNAKQELIDQEKQNVQNLNSQIDSINSSLKSLDN